MRTAILPLLALPPALAQAAPNDTERCFADFTAALADHRGDPEAFLRLVHERIWETWEWPPARKREIYDYLRKGPDGPGKGFAAFAAIGWRDPAAVFALLDAAADPQATPTTRWFCLNAAPCVLGMGDVWMHAEQSAAEQQGFADSLRDLATAAQKTTIGRAHAGTITRILAEQAKAPKESAGGYGMALWHVSAYQLCNLDLATFDVLAPLLDDPGAAAFNVLHALALESNQDFLRALRRDPAKSEAEQQQAAAAALRKAREWWQAHSKDAALPLRERLLLSFADQGIDPKAPTSAASRKALAKLFDAEEPWTQYNAYRLFNELAGTHYDLEFVFFLDKYSLHPIVTGLKAKDQERKLRERALLRLSSLGDPAPK